MLGISSGDAYSVSAQEADRQNFEASKFASGGDSMLTRVDPPSLLCTTILAALTAATVAYSVIYNERRSGICRYILSPIYLLSD